MPPGPAGRARSAPRAPGRRTCAFRRGLSRPGGRGRGAGGPWALPGCGVRPLVLPPSPFPLALPPSPSTAAPAPRARSPTRRLQPASFRGARPPATWGRGPAGAGGGARPRPLLPALGRPSPARARPAGGGRGRGRGCCCAEAPPPPAPGPSVPRGPRRHCAGWAAGPPRDGPGAAASVARPERRRERAGGGRGGGGAAGDAPRGGRRGRAGRAALVVGSAGHRALLLALPHGVPPAGLRD